MSGHHQRERPDLVRVDARAIYVVLAVRLLGRERKKTPFHAAADVSAYAASNAVSRDHTARTMRAILFATAIAARVCPRGSAKESAQRWRRLSRRLAIVARGAGNNTKRAPCVRRDRGEKFTRFVV